MDLDTPLRRDSYRVPVFLRWWAFAVVPAVIILPMYVFPLTLGRPLSGYSGRRMIEIAWAGGLVLAMLSPRFHSQWLRVWDQLPRMCRLALVVLVSGSLVSALISSDPAYALRDWSLLVVLLASVPSLTVIWGDRREQVLEWLGLTVVLYAILVFENPLIHGFANPRFQGQVLAVAAPSLLFSGSPPLSIMAAPAVAVGVINGSRALWLTLLVVPCVLLFLWKDGRRRMLYSGLLGLTLALVLTGVLLVLDHGAPVEAALGKGVSGNGRLSIWLDALRHFTDAPIFGVGPGMLAKNPTLQTAHPHNSVLLIAAELGLVGLASVAVLASAALRHAPLLDPSRRPWALALIGGAFHSLLSGTNVMPASQTLLVLALAMVLRVDARDESRASQSTGGVGLLFTSVALGALIVLVVTVTVLPPGTGVSPRFFRPGIIP